MTPDVNVLVAASRADHPQHAVALAWLEGAADAAQTGAALTLMPMVLANFLRLVTNPRIFQRPTPIDNAVEFVDALVAIAGVRVAPLGPEWPKLRALCRTQQLAANELPDAWLAAAVLHLDEHLFSFDKDFKRLLPRQQFTLLAANS